MNRRQILFCAMLLAAGLAFGTARKARSLGSPDFKVFYTASRHAQTDPENIYRLSPDRYLYPPSTAILLTPFAFTEHFEAHQWTWHALLAALTATLAGGGGAALAAMLLLVRYLAITFSYGQINLVVIALLALVGRAAGWGRFRPAGALWGLATSVKIYPAVLAPLFLPRERRGAYGGAALAGAALLFLPFAWFGLERGTALYGEFLEALRAKGLPTHSHNQSFTALGLRLLTPQEFYLHAVGPAWWGVADLPVAWIRALALALGGALAGAAWWRAWRRGLGADAALSAAAFSILFLSHIVWKDYLLFLYFPLREGFARWPRARSVWVAGVFLALVTLSSPDLVGHPLSTRLDAACIHLWAAVLVWGAWLKEA